MDWREKVTLVSEKIFPGLSYTNPSYFGHELLSNLPLQMCLYFNVTYFPIWLLITGSYLYNEFNCFGQLQKLVLITVLITIIFTEIVRLYLGYQGNLRDKISELAAFWFLSLLLQVPLEGMILINPYFNWQIIEFIAHGTMYSMLLFQITIGYFALKNIARQQANIFRIMRMRNIETKD